MGNKPIGIKVSGMSETLRMLARVDDGIRKEVSDVFRDKAKQIQAEAFARSKGSPGVRRDGYPLTKGAYTRRVSSTSAKVGINRKSKKNAAVFGAEFGAKQWHIPVGKGRKARPISQSRMVRRTFPVWRGNNTTVRGKNGPGWIIMPVLRKRVPQITVELDREITALFIQSARRSGLTRVR